MNWVQKILQKVLIVVTARPLLTLCVALALAVLSIFYTVTNLGFLTSQKELISPSHQLMKLSEQMDQFEDLGGFVVAVENQNPSRSLKFLHALAPRLEADREHYHQIFFRVEPKLFKRWALLYLEKKDLLTLRDSLHEYRGLIQNIVQSPTLTDLFRQINQEMTSRMVGELFTGFLEEKSTEDRKEPLNLDFLIRVLREMTEWLDGDASLVSPWESFLTKQSWGVTSEEGYFWTENRRYLLLFVTPRKMGNRFTQGQESLIALRNTIAEVQTDFPGIQVGVTGPGALDEDEMGVALKDMSLATMFSLAGLTILLVLFWRGIRRPLLEVIQLLVALSLTFGLTTLLIGHLNILSVSFAPMLLGLGIDYGVHWVSRYREEQETRGASKKEALQATMTKLGPGVLLAGLSAALSFFPLVLTGFRGLMELGIICSIGLVTATMMTLCLLPALILMFDKTKDTAGPRLPSGPVKPLLKFSKGQAFLVLVIACVGSVFSLWGASQIRFDLNMLRLQSRRSESVKWEKKLIEDSKHPSMQGAVFARSLEEVEKKTKVLEALPSVSRVESVVTLLPPEQKEKIDLLQEMKPLLAGIHPFQIPSRTVDLSELNEILGRIHFKMMDSGWEVDPSFKAQMEEGGALINDLRQRLRSMERSRLLHRLQTFETALIGDLNNKLDDLQASINAPPMRVDDLPKTLLELFVGKNGLYLIRVFPARNIWEPEILGKFVDDLRAADPEAVGDPVTLYFFTKAFRDACIVAALYAAAFIFLLLLLTFRSLLSTLLAMTPLVVGTIWTFGVMHAFGVDLNLANSIFLPLVVGAGVEYGIIIVQRWRQREAGVILPSSTGQGVILAGLTTTVGFGSLTLSSHQGLYSLGLLTMIGSLVILAAAVLFLPALLQLLKGSKELK
jgi:hopanoid biosynthesis associated RND transporter like protein HpnN